MSSFQCSECGVIHQDWGANGHSLSQGKLPEKSKYIKVEREVYETISENSMKWLALQETQKIETFEQLAEALGVEIRNENGESYILKDVNNVELAYFRSGEFYLEDYWIGTPEPQQAYNIIRCFQKNLKG